MSEKKQTMSGIQRFLLMSAISTFKCYIREYASLTEKEKTAYNKHIADRMFKKACGCKLKEPYDDVEMKFIKEHLN